VCVSVNNYVSVNNLHLHAQTFYIYTIVVYIYVFYIRTNCGIILENILDAHSWFALLFNVEIGRVDIKEMHFTRKYVFILTMQHLFSQIKRKYLVPKARVKSKERNKK
jgi:hypothetical protein